MLQVDLNPNPNYRVFYLCHLYDVGSRLRDVEDILSRHDLEDRLRRLAHDRFRECGWVPTDLDYLSDRNTKILSDPTHPEYERATLFFAPKNVRSAQPFFEDVKPYYKRIRKLVENYIKALKQEAKYLRRTYDFYYTKLEGSADTQPFSALVLSRTIKSTATIGSFTETERLDELSRVRTSLLDLYRCKD